MWQSRRFQDISILVVSNHVEADQIRSCETENLEQHIEVRRKWKATAASNNRTAVCRLYKNIGPLIRCQNTGRDVLPLMKSCN